jgi:hypothetical protein
MFIILTKIDLSLSIELLWKGMLAIFVAMGIICLFTWFLNHIANNWFKKSKK